MIKLKDVAKKAKVSEATASLVLNNRPGVNQKTRDRVLLAAKSLGYTPNTVARGLATRKTNTLGLVVTDIENPFFGSLTRYIDEFAGKEGYNLILSVSNDDLYLEEEIIYDFIGKRVDGVIIVPSFLLREDVSYFAQLQNHKIPYVFSTTYYAGVDCDCVMTDLKKGSYLLAKYLIGLGHRRISFLVSGQPEVLVRKLRVEGCLKAFKEAGLAFNKDWIIQCERPDFFSGYESTLKVLGTYKPEAIMAMNDIMALGAKRAIRERGYSVPDEISVAGYDDVIFSSIPEVPLTTVRQNIPKICLDTVKILIQNMQVRVSEHKVHRIMPELIIRKSTAGRGKT